VLIEWEESGTYADALLAGVDETTPFANPSDRALLHALVLGVLRYKTMLDIWIAELNQRGRLTAPVRWILRLGLFQLLKMGLAEHAAVDESVRLTFEEKPLVNAILRRAIEEKDHLLAIEEDAAAWERFSLPDFLIERWRWLFGEEGMVKLAALMSQPSEMFVRINRLKPWPAVPAGAQPIDEAPDFFKVSSLPRPELEAGHCYVQDPSTWFAVAMLDVHPGMTVLDACAAPGGKAALLAQFMENQGLLVATDSSPRRIRRLAANLKRLGVTCADCRAIDWKSTRPGDDGQRYDRILLDVPCSNTGVMRRRVDVRWRVTPAVVAEMAETQARILRATIPLLAPGGKLSYSTCSLEPAENDQQVDRTLAEFPNLTLVEKKLILPHETGFDGAFVAILGNAR
jgi:16S rRNA (cytosine967-C5)-methyltransferase